MEFDNDQFEKGAKETISTLDSLKKALDFDGADKGLTVFMSAIDNVSHKFSALEVAAITTISHITESVLSGAEHMIRSLSVDNIDLGFSKYEQETKAVQMIRNNTTASMEDVESLIHKLMWYTDETSYSFDAMIGNIGKFTSAGVDLDTAASSMIGIANACGLAGVEVSQATHAMEGFSKAMAAGYMDNRNWSWIRTARLDTQAFKQELIAAGEKTGTLVRGTDGVLRTAKKTEVTWENFQTTLSDKWLDSETMNLALSKFGKYAEEIYEIADAQDLSATDAMAKYSGEVDELGMKSFKAAQEARTFSDAILAVKDAVSSKWTESFNLIFGNYEEAKVVWTDLANYLWDIFAAPGDIRNSIFSFWKENKGRERLLGSFDKETESATGFYNAAHQFKKGIDIVKKAFWGTLGYDTESDTFAEDIGKKLVEWSNKIADFLDGLDLTEEKADKLYKRFSGIFGLFKNIFGGIRNVFGVVKEIFGIFTDVVKEKFGEGVFDDLLSVGNTFADLLKSVKLTEENAKNLRDIFDIILTVAKDIFDFVIGIGKNAGKYINPIVKAIDWVIDLLGKVSRKLKEIHDNSDFSGGFGWLSNIFNAIADFFGNFSFETISSSINSGIQFIGDVISGIMDFASRFGPQTVNLAYIGSLAYLFLRLAESFDRINDSGIRGWLSGDADSVWSETILGRFVTALKSVNIVSIAASIFILVGALSLLGFAIKTIGEMNGADIAKGLVVLAIALAAFYGAIKLATRKDNWKTLLLGAAVLFAISVAAIAAAVAITAIAGAFKLFSIVLGSTDNIGETVFGIVAAFAALFAIAYIMGKTWKTLLPGAAVLLALSIAAIAAAVAIAAIAGAFKLFSVVLGSTDNIGETILGVVGALAALLVVAFIIGKAWITMLKGAVALFAISVAAIAAAVAISAVAGAIKIFDLVISSTEHFGDAVGTLALVFVSFMAIVAVLGMLWGPLLIGSAVLVAFSVATITAAAAIVALSVAIKIFSIIISTTENFAEAVGVLATMFVTLIVVIGLIGAFWPVLLVGAGVLIALSVAIAVASGALLILGAVLGALSAIPVVNFISSVIGLAVALSILGTIAAVLGSFWAPFLIGAGVMVALAIAIAALSGALLLLSAAWNSFDASSVGDGMEFDVNEYGELIVQKVEETATGLEDAADHLNSSANEAEEAYERAANIGAGAPAGAKRNAVNSRNLQSQLGDALLDGFGSTLRNGASVEQYQALLEGDGGVYSLVSYEGAKEAGEAAGKGIPDGIMSAIQNYMPTAEGGMDYTQILSMIGVDGASLTEGGTDITEMLASGISLGKPAVDTSVESIATSTGATLEEAAADAVTKGKNFSEGFANGIDNGSYLAQAAAERLALRALSKLSMTIQEGSPSKLTYITGGYFEEGFSNAITDYAYRSENAARLLGADTLQALGEGLGRMDGIANGTIATAPTIRPVLDARAIQNGSRSLDTMFASRQAMYANIADQERRNSDDMYVLVEVGKAILEAVNSGHDLYLDDHKLVGRINRGLGRR